MRFCPVHTHAGTSLPFPLPVSASYEQALVDSCNIIEQEMERFRICEKDTKTNAFSTEGLGQQPRMDPKEKAKSETRDWLNNTFFRKNNVCETWTYLVFEERR
ncbi:hypothetical protein L2E82_30720 [Cichorium intybus]|uniref:Uncharacterized protein n=1 Tax=Cichorium intybus TaxID=13427 RepID=A0ACB9D1G4_CICIN|nr:hypothetical protein L2E82_30720 [Cichorium intybus]